MPNVDGKKEIIAKDRGKSDSSMRALPLDAGVKSRLIEIKTKQEMYRKKFKRSYSKEWLDYVLVDELGGLITPDYISSAFRKFLEANDMRIIRFHDLRHPNVKYKLKNNSIFLHNFRISQECNFSLKLHPLSIAINCIHPCTINLPVAYRSLVSSIRFQFSCWGTHTLYQ